MTEKEKTLTGFKTQCQYVHPHLMKVIDELIAQNDNLVIEGVHLTVDFMMNVMKKYPFCIPFAVYIKNKEKHKERFAVRSKQMTLDPRYNRYVECFESIRVIHKFFVRKAEKNLVPRIDNTNVDKSLGLIHSTIVRCLRKIVKGELLWDETTSKATNLCHEFNAVSKSGLSSAEAQKVIKSKVNKGEILKRFFGDQTETPLADVQPMEEEGVKRVHSFDENEMEQIRKENEAQKIAENEETKEGTEEPVLNFGFDPLPYRLPEQKQEEIAPAPIVDGPQTAAKSPRSVEIGEKKVEEDGPAEAPAPNEDIIVEKPIKASKSSENLLEEAKKKKKVKFTRNLAFRRLKRFDIENALGAGEEDKQVSIHFAHL